MWEISVDKWRNHFIRIIEMDVLLQAGAQIIINDLTPTGGADWIHVLNQLLLKQGRKVLIIQDAIVSWNGFL